MTIRYGKNRFPAKQNRLRRSLSIALLRDTQEMPLHHDAAVLLAHQVQIMLENDFHHGVDFRYPGGKVGGFAQPAL